MRETRFIRENEEQWKQFENMVENRDKSNPDLLAELFVKITDDLSFARTYFPGTATYLYLNQLASKVHQEIYQNKKEDTKRIFAFWTKELPGIMSTVQGKLLTAFIITAISAIIGYVSSANDSTFARLILGPVYVEMSENFMEQGDPMKVYKLHGEGFMFVRITLNNIMVSFYAFALGIIFSFGTGYVLFRNGVMLGAFHELFFRHDYHWAMLKTVWIHGTLEISAIVIAGAAGLTLGNSFLFPGTYSRLESLKRGALKGAKIVLGLVPIFIVAGFLEGYVTRYSEMHILLSFAIIGLSLSFILAYFVFYPKQIVKELK